MFLVLLLVLGDNIVSQVVMVLMVVDDFGV
jgi:hypothetical protein